MLVVFVHGWSVTNTDTYGSLPAELSKNAPAGLEMETAHLYLGKYVSFADEVNLDDIARGMQQAVESEILPKLRAGEKFACITHSTGGPVVRKWVDLFFKDDLSNCPLGHLVMLAPANHGSALAQLGKGRLSRMKFFMEGVQPGTGVLNWLELGSDQSWELNSAWLEYECMDAGLYVFVLTGQTIDHSFYDHLNSYTGEAGSDGVVRVAAANMNYGLIRLVQQDGGLLLAKAGQSARHAFGILPGRSHSGDSIGIMRSVKEGSGLSHPTVKWALDCLAVTDGESYQTVADELDALTRQTQMEERKRTATDLFLFSREFETHRYCMFVFRIMDDRGNELADYDIIFTAGPQYSESHLPPGFFIDRQRNQINPGKLTYYMDYDVMADWFKKPEVGDKFGFKIAARPAAGYSFYTVAEHCGTFSELGSFFEPNRTLMVEVMLKRLVMEGVFRLTQNLSPEDFKDQPKGAELP
jgi:hypothetical protein